MFRVVYILHALYNGALEIASYWIIFSDEERGEGESEIDTREQQILERRRKSW